MPVCVECGKTPPSGVYVLHLEAEGYVVCGPCLCVAHLHKGNAALLPVTYRDAAKVKEAEAKGAYGNAYENAYEEECRLAYDPLCDCAVCEALDMAEEMAAEMADALFSPTTVGYA